MSIHPQKLYYSRKEVAIELGEEPSTVRFWSEQFNLKVLETAKGKNRYDRKTFEQLKTIRHLLRDKKLTIEGARQALRASKRAARNAELTEQLRLLREQLVVMRRTLEMQELRIPSDTVPINLTFPPSSEETKE